MRLVQATAARVPLLTFGPLWMIRGCPDQHGSAPAAPFGEGFGRLIPHSVPSGLGRQGLHPWDVGSDEPVLLDEKYVGVLTWRALLRASLLPPTLIVRILASLLPPRVVPFCLLITGFPLGPHSACLCLHPALDS